MLPSKKENRGGARPGAGGARPGAGRPKIIPDKLKNLTCKTSVLAKFRAVRAELRLSNSETLNMLVEFWNNHQNI
jgi:hypothetical protein